ncbi:MAG: FAD-dependent oxidoreductase [Gemmatimonadota bacterium]
MPDFIVVGGGSAGAAIASRLSEDPSVSVLLLEAGSDRETSHVTIPAAFAKLFRGPLDWAYDTEPEPALGGRRLFWPRGKMLGGSSAMNAMIWTRGAASDFDGWAAAGNRDWSYAGVRPAFERIERTETEPGAGVTVSEPRTVNPLTRTFLAAAEAEYLTPNPGFRDGVMDGVGLFRVSQRRGARCSTARGYLRPARGRKNLTVMPHARVTRILFQGRCAEGVAYVTTDAGSESRAQGQVILSAGAIGSPQLLLLSGVGPAQELEALGIPVVIDLPGVGQNLHDHLATGTVYRATRPNSLMSAESLPNVLRYLVLRRGPLSSNVAEAGAFLRLDPTRPVCDIELLFAPAFFVDHGQTRVDGHGFTLAAILLHPESRGRIALMSNDPLRPPAIYANYLTSRLDFDRLLAGLEIARRIVAQAAFSADRGAELFPGDSDLDTFIRARSETLYHPAGTCKMGSDPMAVVSDRLEVHGLEGLTVADASIIPTSMTGHPNAASIMIGERAAAWRLARSA